MAEADEGFVFTGYTGDCKPSGRLLMSKPADVRGRVHEGRGRARRADGFAHDCPPGRGNTRGRSHPCGVRGTDCSVEHPQGKVITLKSLAEPEYTFKGFTGDCVRGEMLMNQARRCGAQFVKDRAQVAGNNGNNTGAANTGANNTGAVITASNGAPRSPGGGRGAGSSAGSSSSPSGATSSPYDKTAPPGRATEPADSPAAATKDNAPVLTPDGIAKDAIQRVLEQYRTAYEQLDVQGIKRVYPGAPPAFINGLTYAFKSYKSLEYTYTGAPEYSQPGSGTWYRDCQSSRALES